MLIIRGRDYIPATETEQAYKERACLRAHKKPGAWKIIDTEIKTKALSEWWRNPFKGNAELSGDTFLWLLVTTRKAQLQLLAIRRQGWTSWKDSRPWSADAASLEIGVRSRVWGAQMPGSSMSVCDAQRMFVVLVPGECQIRQFWNPPRSRTKVLYHFLMAIILKSP